MPQNDLTGQQFSRLTVVRDTGRRDHGIVWECVCVCGRTTEATTWQLTSGRKRSCGCLAADSAKADIAGERFGHLVAVRPTDKRKLKTVVWECRCDCGNTCEASVAQLRSGKKIHCGCGLGTKRASAKAEPRKPYVKLDGPRPGQRFGRLVAIEAADRDFNRATMWRCICDCDRIVRARASDLLSGAVTSCGACEEQLGSSASTPRPVR